MNGAIVENLSNRKLFVILTILVLLQIGFFLIGGLIAPKPSSAVDTIMTVCRDLNPSITKQWFFVRPDKIGGCPEMIDDFESRPKPFVPITHNTREFVFVAQIPPYRDGVQLEYSPWFQSLLGLLTVEIEQSEQFKYGKDPELRLEIRLGYRTKDDSAANWHELVSTTISRKLHCTPSVTEMPDGARYNCEPIELFELGSCDYPFYLLNIRLPGGDNATFNQEIGRLRELTLVEIHQNGGFTKVWLSIKTVMFFCILPSLIWYWRRILLLPRNPLLIEKALFSLGVAMLFINVPVEFLSLWIHMPFMLLLTDIRQGIFYAMLLCFWLIFCGEHLLDEGRKNQLGNYWKHLASVLFGCTCLFVFDMCERGVHLTNPFYSIWSTSLGTNLAYVFIVLAAISALVYFAFLFYWVVRVWLTIKRKRVSLSSMKPGRRVRFEGIIYRFKFLMLLTLICAALTVASFIMSEVGEGQLRWGDYLDSPTINYSSAFLTGVYGMWNLYTILLLAMYAPSHKKYSQSVPVSCNGDEDDDEGYTATEASALTTFVAKQSSD